MSADTPGLAAEVRVYQRALARYIDQDLGGAITAADYPEGGEGRIVRLAAAQSYLAGPD